MQGARASEEGAYLRYVTEERASSNEAGGGKDKREVK